MVHINLVRRSSYSSNACRKPTNSLSPDRTNFRLATTNDTSLYQRPKYIHVHIGEPLAFAVSLDEGSRLNRRILNKNTNEVNR
jgi:hypothetical protein